MEGLRGGVGKQSSALWGAEGGRARGPGVSLALACVLPGCRLGELLKTVSGISGRAWGWGPAPWVHPRHPSSDKPQHGFSEGGTN